MLTRLTSGIVNQVIVPGSLFWRREKRALLRRWKRAMLLPETVLLAGLIIVSSLTVDHAAYRPGQAALASNAVIQDGVPSLGAKRKQRALQDRLQTNPETLLTLTGSDIIRAFSYADLQRREGPITILQFRGTGCVLDIYYDEDGQSGTHYEFRARRMAQIDGDEQSDRVRPRGCISDILKSRA